MNKKINILKLFNLSILSFSIILLIILFFQNINIITLITIILLTISFSITMLFGDNISRKIVKKIKKKYNLKKDINLINLEKENSHIYFTYTTSVGFVILIYGISTEEYVKNFSIILGLILLIISNFYLFFQYEPRYQLLHEYYKNKK